MVGGGGVYVDGGLGTGAGASYSADTRDKGAGRHDANSTRGVSIFVVVSVSTLIFSSLYLPLPFLSYTPSLLIHFSSLTIMTTCA